jgi:hypothetical protein
MKIIINPFFQTFLLRIIDENEFMGVKLTPIKNLGLAQN